MQGGYSRIVRRRDRTMIKTELLRDDGILIVSPVDTLEAIDFERVRLLADPHIEEHGELRGLLIDVETFPGWVDFSGMLSHLRFVHDYQQKIKRVAAITDNDILAILPQVADYFAAAEVRRFNYTERDLALNWLRTGIVLP
jgi:SpoIIAA-like